MKTQAQLYGCNKQPVVMICEDVKEVLYVDHDPLFEVDFANFLGKCKDTSKIVATGSRFNLVRMREIIRDSKDPLIDPALGVSIDVIVV